MVDMSHTVQNTYCFFFKEALNICEISGGARCQTSSLFQVHFYAEVNWKDVPHAENSMKEKGINWSSWDKRVDKSWYIFAISWFKTLTRVTIQLNNKFRNNLCFGHNSKISTWILISNFNTWFFLSFYSYLNLFFLVSLILVCDKTFKYK